MMYTTTEKKKTITTSIPHSLYDFLVEESEKNKVSKNSILAEALTIYKKQYLEAQLKQAAIGNYDLNKELVAEYRDVQLSSLSSDA